VSTWNVNLEFDGVDVSSGVDDQIDTLFETLLPLAPVASFEPGRLGVGVTVEDTTPEGALRRAKKAVAPAMLRSRFGRGHLVGVEMYTNEELDRRNAIPNYPEVVGVAEVAEMLGVSKQRVSELARSKRFPSALYELAAGPVWVKPAIERFADAWERKPGRPRKSAAG
jgi:hypothetical protein